MVTSLDSTQATLDLEWWSNDVKNTLIQAVKTDLELNLVLTSIYISCDNRIYPIVIVKGKSQIHIIASNKSQII